MNTLSIPSCCRHISRKHRLIPAIRHILALGGLWLVFGGQVQSAIVEGSEPKDYPPSPEKHVVSIKREAANPVQKKMIAAAEAAIPNEEALREALDGKELSKDEVQWWHEEKLGIRIPFAITGAAVEYYRNLVEGYGKQAFKRYMEPSSKLEYRADVAFHQNFGHEGKTFKDVYVVTLKLTFSERFAATTTEAMNFEKQRTVILDANGAVLAISGDGPTEAPVIAI